MSTKIVLTKGAFEHLEKSLRHAGIDPSSITIATKKPNGDREINYPFPINEALDRMITILGGEVEIEEEEGILRISLP